MTLAAHSSKYLYSVRFQAISMTSDEPSVIRFSDSFFTRYLLSAFLWISGSPSYTNYVHREKWQSLLTHFESTRVQFRQYVGTHLNNAHLTTTNCTATRCMIPKKCKQNIFEYFVWKTIFLTLKAWGSFKNKWSFTYIWATLIWLWRYKCIPKTPQSVDSDPWQVIPSCIWFIIYAFWCEERREKSSHCMFARA